jgi:hypothetical protein
MAKAPLTCRAMSGIIQKKKRQRIRVTNAKERFVNLPMLIVSNLKDSWPLLNPVVLLALLTAVHLRTVRNITLY